MEELTWWGELSFDRWVGTTGFEPATFWSRTRRATRLRYVPTETNEQPNGRGKGIWTPDFLDPNQTRYQAALCPDSNKPKKHLWVGTTGFEPATFGPPDRCATRLRYVPTVSLRTPIPQRRSVSPVRRVAKLIELLENPPQLGTTLPCCKKIIHLCSQLWMPPQYGRLSLPLSPCHVIPPHSRWLNSKTKQRFCQPTTNKLIPTPLSTKKPAKMTSFFVHYTAISRILSRTIIYLVLTLPPESNELTFRSNRSWNAALSPGRAWRFPVSRQDEYGNFWLEDKNTHTLFTFPSPRRSFSAGGFLSPPSPRLRRVKVVLSLCRYPAPYFAVWMVGVTHCPFLWSSDFPSRLSRDDYPLCNELMYYTTFLGFCQ